MVDMSFSESKACSSWTTLACSGEPAAPGPLPDASVCMCVRQCRGVRACGDVRSSAPLSIINQAGGCEIDSRAGDQHDPV